MVLLCFTCKQEKDVEQFSKLTSAKRGYNTNCKLCVKSKRAHLKVVRGKVTGNTSILCERCDHPIGGTRAKKYCSDSCASKSRRIRSYGISVAEYKELLKATNGICPICQKPTENWNIDHNHQTHEAYGLVCGTCNSQLLAWSFHNPELIKRLLDYVENPPVRQQLGSRYVSERVINKNKERDQEGPWVWRKNASKD